MRRYFLITLFLISFVFNSFTQEKWKTIKPVKDTSLLSELLIYHAECTSCMDAEIDTGRIRVPDSLLAKRPTYGFSNIKFEFTDESVFTTLFGDYKSKKFDDMYLIRGKMVGILPPTKAHGYVPVIDVYEYKLVRKYLEHNPTVVEWKNVDSLYQPLPSSVHVFFGDEQTLHSDPFRAYYLVADLKDRNLEFIVDTTKDRRMTPSKYYERNDRALAVVNTTFFSFATNRNLNVVVKDGKLVGYNIHTINGRGKDTFTYRHPFGSAIGISKKRKPDIAWLYTDSSMTMPYALQFCPELIKDSNTVLVKEAVLKEEFSSSEAFGIGNYQTGRFAKWEMKTAVGGGPVLVQDGEVMITNDEELKFAGKAIEDRHPRTAMGYTKDGRLIILVIEGRNKNAVGATLWETAYLLQDLGCIEALNLDGGGSSCLLVNGKETIKISDATGQRPVPAVFIIRNKK